MRLSHGRLLEVLNYNPATGQFTWRIKTCRKVVPGRTAGHKDHRGYVWIRLDRKIWRAHVLAWLYVNGEMPSSQIDHINRCPSDNRISNLRLATDSQNRANMKRSTRNTSGFKGVHWNSQTNKWRACVVKDHKKHYCGEFDDPVEGAQAYIAKATELHGEFATSGE